MGLATASFRGLVSSVGAGGTPGSMPANRTHGVLLQYDCCWERPPYDRNERARAWLPVFFIWRYAAPQNASPGTRTQPSINTRALRLMIALVTVHWPLTWLASAPTRRVPEG